MATDVSIEIKFLGKLVDILKSYFGPTFVRKGAEAEAHARRVKSKAEAEARLIDAQTAINEKKLLLQGEHELRMLGRHLEAHERMVVETDTFADDIIPVLWDEPVSADLIVDEGRLRPFEYVEMRRLNNVRQAAGETLRALPMHAEVSDEPVDPDWYARFFDAVKDVSQQEMQKLWGALLAGEVARPGTYSLRVLETLRLLTTSEARLFEACIHLCSNEGVLLDPPKRNLDRLPIITLIECGLLSGGMITIDPGTTKTSTYGTRTLVVDNPGRPKMPVSIDGWHITGVARELASLRRRTVDYEHLSVLCEDLNGYYGLTAKIVDTDAGGKETESLRQEEQ
ncbi:DUF2806 domain-containing protein [Sorangium sp. So ce1128]